MQVSPDWATWAQVVGTAVQIIVLSVLVWQVWVNRRQAKVAEDTLEFARQQHKDAVARIAQDRVDAVRPALAVIQLEHGEITYVYSEEQENDRERPVPTATYELENFGRGPAASITVSVCSVDDRPSHSQRIQGIGPGNKATVTLWLWTVGSGQLIITFEDILGTRYERRMSINWGYDVERDVSYPCLDETHS